MQEPRHLRTPWSSAPGRCEVASPALCCQSTSCNMLTLTLCCLFLKTQQNLVGAQMGGIWYESLCLHPAKTGSGNGSGSVGGGKLCWVLREPSCWQLLRSKHSRNSAEWGGPGGLFVGPLMGLSCQVNWFGWWEVAGVWCGNAEAPLGAGHCHWWGQGVPLGAGSYKAGTHG